jgi:hypothetical protein
MTTAVPNDGWFYVVWQGEMTGRFRLKNQALKMYSTLLNESGYKPPKPEPADKKDGAVERYMDELEGYWLDSHKHARRGGKGRF